MLAHRLQRWATILPAPGCEFRAAGAYHAVGALQSKTTALKA